MGQRAYKRKSNGQFAGGGSGQGTKVTMGKAGGFANASHRARVPAAKANAARSRMRQAVKQKTIKIVGTGIGVAAAGAAFHYASNRTPLDRAMNKKYKSQQAYKRNLLKSQDAHFNLVSKSINREMNRKYKLQQSRRVI